MRSILIGFIVLFSSLSSYADDFTVLSLDEIKIDYIDFFPKGRDPLITHNGLEGRELGKLLDLTMNTTVLKYGYWRTLVHSMTDAYSLTHKEGQFRMVGLNMEAGIRLAPFLETYVYHYSQHILDSDPNGVGGFPVADGVGVRVIIFRKDKKESLF